MDFFGTCGIHKGIRNSSITCQNLSRTSHHMPSWHTGCARFLVSQALSLKVRMSWEEAQITFVADGAFASYCCVTNHPTPALADHACLAHYFCQLVGWLCPTGLGWLYSHQLAFGCSNGGDRAPHPPAGEPRLSLIEWAEVGKVLKPRHRPGSVEIFTTFCLPKQVTESAWNQRLRPLISPLDGRSCKVLLSVL